MTRDVWSVLGRSVTTAAQRLHVRSALNPVLWMCAVVMPLSIIGAYLFRDVPEVRAAFVAAFLIPPITACLGFIGFAIFKPEKLQSEEYQIRHESLQLIQEKSGRIQLNTASLEAIANPMGLLGPGKEPRR